MIFSADLDRTLIFSQRRLDPNGPPVIPVEYRQDQPAGFMTPLSLSTLRALQSETIFLLNTLRGLEQARRVSFIADNSCTYLALQNGLYLYHGGQEVQEWSCFVQQTVAQLPLKLPDAITRVLGELSGIQCLSKQYQFLAVFFVDDSFLEPPCNLLAAELAPLGWRLCRQGRKLYLSPLPIHKGSVLDYVRHRESQEYAVGFGDSLFDLPMLRACQSAWSLRDCELWNHPWDFPLQFSSLPAQAGSEETLIHIRRSLRNVTLE